MFAIHPSSVIVRVLTLVPWLSRFLLRIYLRANGPIPDRTRWFVRCLKVRLAPDKAKGRVSIGEGLKLDVNFRTTAGRELYYYGTCERLLVNLLGRLLKPGMTFIDAGANLGEFTVRAAHLVGSQGRVIALEASPDTFEHLLQNVRLNRLSNVEVICAALGANDDPKTFFLGNEVDSGASSLTMPGILFSGRTVTVSGVCLDTLVKRYMVENVDVIKMDIEGAEMEALFGGSGLLSGDRAPILLIEYNAPVARRAGWELTQLCEALAAKGYTARPITELGIGSPLQGGNVSDDLTDPELKIDLIVSRCEQSLPLVSRV